MELKFSSPRKLHCFKFDCLRSVYIERTRGCFLFSLFVCTLALYISYTCAPTREQLSAFFPRRPNAPCVWARNQCSRTKRREEGSSKTRSQIKWHRFVQIWVRADKSICRAGVVVDKRGGRAGATHQFCAPFRSRCLLTDSCEQRTRPPPSACHAKLRLCLKCSVTEYTPLKWSEFAHTRPSRLWILKKRCLFDER